MIILNLLICGAVALAAERPRVVAGLREPVNTLSPFAPATIDGYRLTGLIFEPLAKVDPRADTLDPWLARSWTVEGRTLRVILRDDVRFHDGHALSAADVVATFARFRDPGNNAATWLPLWQGVDTARAVGDRVVDFTAVTTWTFESLRNLLANLRVQPAHRPAKDLVGTGPFRAPAPALAFTLYDEWWHQPRPGFDLTFKTVADEVGARALVARGELDFFPAARPGEHVREAGTGDGFWIDLNVRRPPFDDRRVREAMLAAWDRARLNRQIFEGRRRVALDGFDPGFAHYPAGEPVAFDLTRAEKLLREAGWRRDGLGWRREDRRLGFDLLVANADQERWANSFVADLAKRGITVRLVRRALDAEWWRLLRAGDFDAAAGGGAPALTVNADAWRGAAAYNLHGLADPKIDELLAKQDVEFAPKRRAVNARRLIEMVRGQLAQLPGLIAPHALYFVSPRLHFDPARPEDVTRWRVDATRR